MQKQELLREMDNTGITHLLKDNKADLTESLAYEILTPEQRK
jgi:hypothetical protein